MGIMCYLCTFFVNHLLLERATSAKKDTSYKISTSGESKKIRNEN